MSFFVGCMLSLLAQSAQAAPLPYGGLAPGARPAGALRPLIGGPIDEAQAYPGVGQLTTVGAEGSAQTSCTATLIAPDVLLTAAHCVPEHIDDAGWLRAERGLTRLLWVPATRPIPLGRHRAYEVVAGARLPGYNFDFWRLYEAPLLGRTPQNKVERKAAAAFEKACGDIDRLFDAQARLRCLASLPPDLQRALGVADAEWSAQDVAVLFLAEPVVGIAPVKVAEPPPDAFAAAEALVHGAQSNADDADAEGEDEGEDAGQAPRPETPLAGADDDAPSAAASGAPDAPPAFAPTGRTPVGPALEGAPVVVVGYGWASRTPGLSWLFVTPYGSRRASAAHVFALGHHQMQLEERHPVCYGDSGGPVLQRAADGAWQVVGISSAMLPHADNLCAPHATYMRADVVRPWVMATMEAACQDGRRSAAGCAYGLR